MNEQKYRQLDEEKGRFCPLMSRPDRETGIVDFVKCIGDRCGFWTMVYTIESYQEWGCAYALQPNMNKDGRFNV